MFAFKISLGRIIETYFNDLEVSYYTILKTNKLYPLNSLDESIKMVDTRNKLLSLNIKKLSTIIRSIEKDLSNKLEDQRVLRTFDEFWDSYTQKNKLYLKDLSLNTSRKTYSFAFYEISDKNDFNSIDVLSSFVRNLNMDLDFSQSDKVPRNFGGFMAMFQKINLKYRPPEPPEKGK